jgi:hypothetical protein
MTTRWQSKLSFFCMSHETQTHATCKENHGCLQTIEFTKTGIHTPDSPSQTTFTSKVPLGRVWSLCGKWIYALDSWKQDLVCVLSCKQVFIVPSIKFALLSSGFPLLCPLSCCWSCLILYGIVLIGSWFPKKPRITSLSAALPILLNLVLPVVIKCFPQPRYPQIWGHAMICPAKKRETVF